MSEQQEEQDLRLAEYVLGVLSADERRDLEQRLESDPDYALQLVAWQERLAPLISQVPEATPPAFVWARIRDELGLPAPAVADTRSTTPPAGFWNSLALWRWLSASSLAAVLVMATMLWNPVSEDSAATPLLAASLQLEGGQTAFTAMLDTEQKRMVVVPVASLELEGRVAELWLIAGDRAPISMGLLPAQGAASMELPDDLLALAQVSSVFAVSLEPQGGSPTGQPSGPVVAQGALATI